MNPVILNKIFDQDEGFKIMVQYATVGIILVDYSGHIVFANPYAERLFGYSESEIIHMPVESLIPYDLRKSHKSHREKYHQHPEQRQMGAGIDLMALRKDGTSFPAEISLGHFYKENKLFVLAFISDISLRRKIEDLEKIYAAKLEKEVRNRTEALAISLAREVRLNELKSRFVSLASHEFRTPLSTILTSAALIDRYRDEEQLEKRNKHIERIKSSVRMMKNILEDFLSLDKLNEGKVAPELEEIDLGQLFKEIQEELETHLKPDQYISIVLKHEGICLSDKRILKNTLINLTSNAIKYSKEGQKISLHSQSDRDHIIIRVSDEGIGIPLKDQKNLFELFFRASNVGLIKGSGLGLNIVKKYIELLKGEIQCESEEGKGTSFRISLPKYPNSSAKTAIKQCPS